MTDLGLTYSEGGPVPRLNYTEPPIPYIHRNLDYIIGVKKITCRNCGGTGMRQDVSSQIYVFPIKCSYCSGSGKIRIDPRSATPEHGITIADIRAAAEKLKEYDSL